MKKGVFSISRESEIGKQIESLYADYVNGDKYAISDAFNLIQPEIDETARRLSASTYGRIPEQEYQSYMYEAVWNAFAYYDEAMSACFTTYLSRTVSQAATDVFKNRTAGAHGKYAKRVQLTYKGETEDGIDAAFSRKFEFRDDLPSISGAITHDHFEMIPTKLDVEAEVIDRLMRENQRELIEYLYEKAPEHVRAYMVELYGEFADRPRMSSEDEDVTMNKIAEMFGVHHTKVTRGFRSLRGFYDVKRFGDITDYVPDFICVAELPPKKPKKRGKGSDRDRG